MPTLLLLNGPPGVGKSTLAERWTQARPARGCVDPDRLRAQSGEPLSDAALLAAREDALTEVAARLADGDSVAVAQLCGRPDYPDRLRELAAGCGATYVEILLLDSLAHLQQRLRDRAASSRPHHRLAHGDLADGRLRAYREALVARAGADPNIVVVECSDGQQDIALRAIEQVVATS